jgi:predicted membrane-bound spermidine synthase
MEATAVESGVVRTGAPSARRLPEGLALAFLLSGAAGLAYELAWTRYLALLVGHAAYAQVLVLSVYLGGTAVGSLLVAGRSRALERPLRAYARVELGLAAFGLGFHGLYLVGQSALYGVVAPALEGAAALRFASWGVALLLILPQAVLLGATFPLMAAGVLRRAPKLPGRSVSDVYLLNTLGGAAGILFAGFVLIPSIGLPGTAITAGVLNAAAALLAWRGDGTGLGPAVPDRLARPVDAPPERLIVPLLLGSTLVSALASFLYEIGWVRMLSLLLGSATHAFELMLSAFLLGLAGGSLLVRRFADRWVRPLLAAGLIQWTMGLAALLTLPVYEAGFPMMAWLVTNLRGANHGYLLFNAARYGIALLVMLPATLLAGMTLPLFVATLLRLGAGERAIGLANGANTLGSVAGAVLGGLVVLPGLGLERTLAVGASADMVVGVALLATAAAAATRGRALGAAVVSGVTACLVIFAVTRVVALDRATLTSGVFRTGRLPGDAPPEILFYRDGATATIAVHRTRGRITTLNTNGKPDASLPFRWLEPGTGLQEARAPIAGSDESTQVYGPLVLLAHNPGARRAAIIGHGSGMSGQLLLGSPRIESLTTIEIEPTILAASRSFMPANGRVFTDTRSTFRFDDARTALAAGAPLDLIFSEPSNPWVSGVASLFTVQLYERVRDRLSPTGVFRQWFHLYEIEDDLVLSVLAAIDRSFPDWNAWLVGTSDILIVAGKRRLPDPDFSVAREEGVRATLGLAPLPAPGQLESLRIFDADGFRPVLAGRAPNDDYRTILDTRAERARFLQVGAEGMVAFREAALPLPRVLALRRFTPLPYDPLPITGITPLTAHAMAGWLVGEEWRRTAAPHPDWQYALQREQSFMTRVSGTEPPVDWGAWARIFLQVETARHGRSAGWADDPLYDAVERFMAQHDAPDDVRAVVALLGGIRRFDFAAAAVGADVLGATEGPNRLVPTSLLLDASVAAYLGSGRQADARAAFEALAKASGRSSSNARNLWIAALVGAER